MKRLVPALVCLGLVIVLAAGCAPTRTTVVLMPDPDGHVGKAEVFTDGGRRLLEHAGARTTVSGRSSAPTAVEIASAESLAAVFGEVMAIEPLPAEKFILYFHTSTTDLVPESQPVFEAIVAAAKRRAAVSISVSGHTDSSGSAHQNQILASDRANAISDLLVERGIDRERLTVSSHGEGNQLVTTAKGVAQPKNRRVEVVVR